MASVFSPCLRDGFCGYYGPVSLPALRCVSRVRDAGRD